MMGMRRTYRGLGMEGPRVCSRGGEVCKDFEMAMGVFVNRVVGGGTL